MCAMGALAQVGMQDFSQHKIASLSGGQRQRVMIARALCAHPKILILDEPTSSIDIDGQKQIYQLLKELNSYMTIIVVSHDLSMVVQYANKVIHINKRLTYHDTSSDEHQMSHQCNHFCEVELFNLFQKA
jgi:zinc transport system ATP-binding protein